jgi:hypothetical protein
MGAVIKVCRERRGIEQSTFLVPPGFADNSDISPRTNAANAGDCWATAAS